MFALVLNSELAKPDREFSIMNQQLSMQIYCDNRKRLHKKREAAPTVVWDEREIKIAEVTSCETALSRPYN